MSLQRRRGTARRRRRLRRRTNEIKTRALIYDNIRYRKYVFLLQEEKHGYTDQGTKIENKSSNGPLYVKLKFVIETHIILLDVLFHSLLLLGTISYTPTTYLPLQPKYL
jgi:hypothetical protein